MASVAPVLQLAFSRTPFEAPQKVSAERMRLWHAVHDFCRQPEVPVKMRDWDRLAECVSNRLVVVVKPVPPLTT
jgi:hypothetical protein